MMVYIFNAVTAKPSSSPTTPNSPTICTGMRCESAQKNVPMPTPQMLAHLSVFSTRDQLRAP